MSDQMLVCEHCADAIVRRAFGPRPKYCSIYCKGAASRARLGRAHANAGKARRWYRDHPRLSITCASCAQTFDAARADRKTCSAECRQAWNTKRMRERGWWRGRKARRRGADVIQVVDRLAVCERDDWRCGICGDAVPKEARWPDPMSATLDHVTPVSRGGSHTESNVRLAHLVCNQRRGAADARACA
jgi:hypothetical protein